MAYIGFSMSERAKEAYISGEKPLSKWTKKEILSEIEETYSIKAAEFCKRFSINFLKFQRAFIFNNNTNNDFCWNVYCKDV